MFGEDGVQREVYKLKEEPKKGDSGEKEKKKGGGRRKRKEKREKKVRREGGIIDRAKMSVRPTLYLKQV